MRAPLPAAMLLIACLALPAARLRAATTHTSRVAAPLPEAPTCPLFPANNVWNRDVSALPTATGSAASIQAIDPQNTSHLHPDFGSDPSYGIPYNVVGSGQPLLHVGFDYAGESDLGPYPIPPNPHIEAGSDRHILIVDKDACTLYELWNTSGSGQSWHAGSGAIWNLRSNALRPDGWTSADAAGLPILPGLARYDEVAAGVIDHALRFTLATTRKAHIYPARHDASNNTSLNLPPMGLRVRLKASVDISGFGPQARVVLTALKRYGMILADNGSNWYISGASNPAWQDNDLHGLGQIHSADLEVVDTSGLRNGPDPSGPTVTATSTATAIPTATGKSTVTATPSPTQTPTAAATSTWTATPTPTLASTSTATATAIATPISTATPTSSPSRTATATATSTSTASRTSTPLPTATLTPSATATPWQPGIVSLTPVADSYVRDGQYSATNSWIRCQPVREEFLRRIQPDRLCALRPLGRSWHDRRRHLAALRAQHRGQQLQRQSLRLPGVEHDLGRGGQHRDHLEHAARPRRDRDRQLHDHQQCCPLLHVGCDGRSRPEGPADLRGCDAQRRRVARRVQHPRGDLEPAAASAHHPVGPRSGAPAPLHRQLPGESNAATHPQAGGGAPQCASVAAVASGDDGFRYVRRRPVPLHPMQPSIGPHAVPGGQPHQGPHANQHRLDPYRVHQRPHHQQRQ